MLVTLGPLDNGGPGGRCQGPQRLAGTPPVSARAVCGPGALLNAYLWVGSEAAPLWPCAVPGVLAAVSESLRGLRWSLAGPRVASRLVSGRALPRLGLRTFRLYCSWAMRDTGRLAQTCWEPWPSQVCRAWWRSDGGNLRGCGGGRMESPW